MIGTSPLDYGIDKASNGIAARMLKDFEEGHFSFLADEATVEKRYNQSAQGSVWHDFKRACRAYSTLNGCVVIVDDTNQCFVDSVDIHGEYEFEFANEFARRAAPTYRERLLALGKQGPVRLTFYRLPRANYENTAWGHFWERGEYIGEMRMALA